MVLDPNGPMTVLEEAKMASFAKRYPLEQLFSGLYVDAVEKTADCTECGECEERCPYHLPIREMIAQRVKWYQEEKRKYQEQITSRSTR